MKRSKNVALLILLSLVITSCAEDDPKTDDSEQLETGKITVYDANSWTNESAPLEIVVGADVKLFKDETTYNSGIPDYEVLTDNNGIAIFLVPTPLDLDGDGFYEENDPNFIILIEKNGKTNLKEGFGISGVFLCQSELNETIQDGAALGDMRYADVNGDGVIDSDDKIAYGYITLKLEGTDDCPCPADIPGSTSCDNKPTDDNAVYIGQ